MYNRTVLLILVITFQLLQSQLFTNIDIKFYKNNKVYILTLADQINHEPEVTDVWIEEQNVSTLKAGSFSNLLQLKTIKIEDSGLQEIEQHAFQNLPSLRILNLNRNQLKIINEEFFQNLTITRLYLAFNAITTLADGAFHNLKHLQVLDLSHNQIKELRPYMFIGTLYMKKLDLSFNKIEAIPDDCFLYGFSNVVKGEDSLLDLSDNQIVKLQKQAFNGIYNIKELSLNNNNMMGIDGDVLNLLDAEIIELQNNNLKSLDVKILKNLQYATRIRLDGNPWSCSFTKNWKDWCEKYHNHKLFCTIENNCNK